MATQKNYKYEGGVITEVEGLDMVGWEYTDNGFTKRIVCESVGIYNHANYAEAKYVIQVNAGTKWVDYSRESAVVSKNTYCENVAPYLPVSEGDAYEEIDGVRQLKANVLIEWDFYYPVFFDPQSTGANMYNFIKNGAQLKAGAIL
jgi:hypothetical protein